MENPYLPPESEISAPPQDADQFVFAGFWQRFAAMIIDSILLMVITAPLTFMAYGVDGFTDESFLQGPLDFVINWVIPIVAIVWFWKTRGATPGKMAMGIKIVSITGGSLSLGQCIGRYFGYLLSALVICLGYLWMLWDPKKQTWHDKLSGTLVIRK